VLAKKKICGISKRLKEEKWSESNDKTRSTKLPAKTT
jgi:hypothetical protein